MKVSEITSNIIYSHIREIKENLEQSEKDLIEAIKVASISFCCEYTGLKVEELDNHEDVTIAVLTLISDMWDERSMTVDKSNVNRVIDTILSMHCVNLLPSSD